VANSIVIVTGFSLSRNPRALKEATTLRKAGHDVIVLGAALDPPSYEEDLELAKRDDVVFETVGSFDDSGSWRRWRNRAARVLLKTAGIESRFQLGQFVSDLLRRARILRADYYIVHLEQALWVGQQLLDKGIRVGLDMEDWYSEDLLPETRRHRPLRLLRSLEASLLRDAAHSTTTSQSMSVALAKHFACPPPLTVYNAFPWSDRETIDGAIKDRADRETMSIHWYSQTLGPGRGLEDLIGALPFFEHDAEIHLRGNPAQGFSAWLDTQIHGDWRRRIFFHDLVPNDELLSRLAEHDIGFAGEQKYCKSRDLTVTNKILHYLLGGLAVVASDTTGQREVAQQAGGGVHLYRVGDPRDLARKLNLLLSSPAQLARTKEAALAAARETFCWERQAPILLQSVEAALGIG
jgi:glycosyltransferase involved in cell wall biosynthesis